MFLSLPTLTALIPLVCLAALLCSASVGGNFLRGCSSTTSVCFHHLLPPLTVPVSVLSYRWAWTGIKVFRHN
ncbi:phosphatidylinositol N-acetylglucosaminyltransferase subunit Y-like [Ailuropoda melanoleuca]|uniref:phosphatidylinositol N-acetylglucosaminyltransferase subunit Y-like n=1 Tax=Ailuropoda melanoleuca TaxID=9646 RepID=UPI0001DECC3D|nr:phosphatidylinositol N-acetylglucosaminyltransferase subunit Y-like [Ailuropoda melanoleuca]